MDVIWYVQWYITGYAWGMGMSYKSGYDGKQKKREWKEKVRSMYVGLKDAATNRATNPKDCHPPRLERPAASSIYQEPEGNTAPSRS